MLKKQTQKYLLKHMNNDITGKTVVVTGATSGVGLKAVEELLFLKAKVIMAVRNIEKAEEKKEMLLKEYKDSSIEIYPLDLASMDSIKKFAMRIKRNKVDIYAFINNAGVYHMPFSRTQDGLELVLGTNYIGVYQLIERLLPYFLSLPHKVKLINQCSISYKWGKINYNDFFRLQRYKKMKVYAQSKYCMVLYSIYLANRYMDTNLEVTMTHPGICRTPLMVNAYKKGIKKIVLPFLHIFQGPEKSALSIPYVVSNEIRSGSFVGPSHMFDGWGNPKINKLKKKAYNGNQMLVNFTKAMLDTKE